MRNVAEKELQINLNAILTRAQSERIVISRGGKPCAVLVGIEDYDAEGQFAWRARRISGG